jgi:hypothetical protein
MKAGRMYYWALGHIFWIDLLGRVEALDSWRLIV